MKGLSKPFGEAGARTTITGATIIKKPAQGRNSD
jgi:hypothetical protein